MITINQIFNDRPLKEIFLILRLKKIIILDCSYFSTNSHLYENLVLIRKDTNKVKKYDVLSLFSLPIHLFL